MRIFLDTANIQQIRDAVRLGVISGITTNPSLLAQEKQRSYEAAIKEICALVSGPVSAEVTVTGTDQMLQQARLIASWAQNVVIKIPATADGLQVTSTLAGEGIRVNLTLCFSLNQALLGALAGAAFVSLFVGRLDDVGHDGMALVKDTVEVFNNYNLSTQVLAASIRHPLHCVEAARAGAHIATVPYAVLMQMIRHPLTDAGIKRFLDDWEKASR